jgi:phospholipid transport system transporter-binding protein
VARREGNRLLLEGEVTAGTVPALLDAGATELRGGVEVVDFAAVTEVDSAALALALAWLREARAAGRTIRFANLPQAMENLARLYGVDGLLPVARSGS